MAGIIQTKNLEKLFDLKSEIKDVKDELEELPESYIDTDLVLKRNIQRAEALLDRIDEEINNGVMDARLLTAASSLIAAVTQAANSFITNSTSLDMLALKQEDLELKKKQLELREAVNAARNNTPVTQTNIQNNVVVSSREEILKLLNGETKEV